MKNSIELRPLDELSKEELLAILKVTQKRHHEMYKNFLQVQQNLKTLLCLENAKATDMLLESTKNLVDVTLNKEHGE